MVEVTEGDTLLGSKKKKFEKAANRFLTGSGLLKAAVARDQDMLVAMATGQAADDDGLWYALQTFLRVAHDHPGVVAQLRDVQSNMPPKAQMAFTTAIQAAERGDPSLFNGGNVVGQGLLIVSLSAAISEDADALADAMVTLGENA